MVEDHRKLPPTYGLTTPTNPPASTLPPAVAAADGLSEVAGADTAPAGADTDAVAAVRSEAAALLGAGRSPLGMLLTTCKHTEATTPYHPWRAVFERFFTEDTLRSFVALCDRGSPSPSRPPPQARPPPSPLRGSPLRMDGGTSPAASSGRASFGRASFLRGGSSPQPARGHLYVQSFAEDHPPRSVAGGCTQRTPAQGRPRRSAQAVRVSPLMTKATLLSWRHQWRRAVEPPPPPFRWAA